MKTGNFRTLVATEYTTWTCDRCGYVRLIFEANKRDVPTIRASNKEVELCEKCLEELLGAYWRDEE